MLLDEEIANLITHFGQPHLLEGLECAPIERREAFLRQLQSYPNTLLQAQKRALFHRTSNPLLLEPLSTYAFSGSLDCQQKGQMLLASGKVGCLILAGGQGSRLSTSFPKGCTPVSLIKQKSLFQLFFERVKAASKKAGTTLPIAVMTSPLNHAETQAFLSSNHWFGLHSSQVTLFSQSVAPLLDDRGNWMLEEIGKIAEGPDGNGGALAAFFKAGIWMKWQQMGIEMVNVVPIDNPLADPFDNELCGFHATSQNEVTLKCIERQDPEEKVGIIASHGDHLKIVEYSEQTEEQKYGKNPEGSLEFSLANIGLFCFSLDFIRKAAKSLLPWHMARKEAKILRGTAKAFYKETIKIWKCETFIFDLLDYTTNAKALVYPREICFSPLKNATGGDSLDTLREAMLHFDRAAYHRVSNVYPQDQTFELDPTFYYPTSTLLMKWKGKPLPRNGYITPD